MIRTPRHPYTQLLVSSVPEPDPTRRWAADLPDADQTVSSPEETPDGCAFADRCPHVMEMCTQSRPPLYRPSEHQVAACFLHKDAGRTLEGDVSQAFRVGTPTAAAQAPAPPGA